MRSQGQIMMDLYPASFLDGYKHVGRFFTNPGQKMASINPSNDPPLSLFGSAPLSLSSTFLPQT